MAEAYIQNLYEKIVVASLVRPHSRLPNPTLTPTERTRLTLSFLQTWNLLLHIATDPSGVKADLLAIPMKAMFRIHEVARFLHNNLNAEQLEQVTRLQGGEFEKNGSFDVEKCKEGLIALVVIGNERMEARGQPGFTMPYRQPLGFFAMFDHWQVDYMEQFE